MNPTTCPPVLIETLRRWTLRQRWRHALRTFGWTVIGAGLLIATAMVVDLAGDPLPWLRIVLAATALLGLLAGLVVAIRRMLVVRNLPDAARELELAAGLHGEPLSGPLFLAQRPAAGHSQWMVDRALALSGVIADALDVRRLLPWRPAMPAVLGALCTVLILLSAALAHPTARAALARALLPWQELPAPGDELVAAEPGDTWVAPGAQLACIVRDQTTALTAELHWADGSHEIRPMVRDGTQQRLMVGPLHHDVRWRVRGPSLASTWRTASVVAVPRLAALAMQLTPPAYSGLPEERLQGGDALVIAGTAVAIDVALEGAPAVTATLVVEEREVPLPLTPAREGRQSGSARLHIASDQSWRLRLIVEGGPGGVVVDLPQRWRIRAAPDLPPRVAATADASLVTRDRAIRISVLASDDVALASTWLELASEDSGKPIHVALPVPASTRRLEATAVIVPTDLGVHPGDRLSATPIARDCAGNETRGAPVVISIAQPIEAAHHDLVTRLEELVTLTGIASEAASESEKTWRAAVRAWRKEDPTAGAAGLRAAASRVRSLSTAAIAIADGAEAAAALDHAPGNLESLSNRALVVAGGALALAARSVAAESGAAEAVNGATEAASALVRSAAILVDAATLAAGATAAAAATADLVAAHDQLIGAAAVLAAERAWTMPPWQPGLLATFWRGREPGAGTPGHRTTEAPNIADRNVPGLGREDWCARWEGEILLNEASRWSFRCTADDGVRMRVAGQDLFPSGSWRDQPATAYIGSLELPAGWHPVAVEFYQSTGPSSLTVEVGRGEPALLTLDRLRSRRPAERLSQQAMTMLPAGAAEAAAVRARHAGETAMVAAAALTQAVARVRSRSGLAGLPTPDNQPATTLRSVNEVLDWSDGRAVDSTAQAVATAVEQATAITRLLTDACRNDGRDGGGASGGLTLRLRGAAAKPGSPEARPLAEELLRQRTACAALASDGLLDPARRATALATAWAIDAVATALAGNDADAARAAVAAVSPLLALSARHARAAEAAASATRRGNALMTELALSPGWPPGLLRPSRDLLRAAAAALRAGGATERAAILAGEVVYAVDLEALRPGAPPSEALTTAATWLHDLGNQPQAEALAEIADLLEQVDSGGSQARPQARIRAAAAQARRTAAAAALDTSASKLAAAAPALALAGFADLSARASSLAELARTIAASPDQTLAKNLAEALAGSLAAPLADALGDGRIEAGSNAAMAGRLAAQTAAAAAALAPLAEPAAVSTDDQDAGWGRSRDQLANGAASAAAVVIFPEEHQAAIRAYLRRIGATR